MFFDVSVLLPSSPDVMVCRGGGTKRFVRVEEVFNLKRERETEKTYAAVEGAIIISLFNYFKS